MNEKVSKLAPPSDDFFVPEKSFVEENTMSVYQNEIYEEVLNKSIVED
jgi:hypothetical protein